MNNFKVLFVPGIFARPIHYIFGTYFIDQVNFLNEKGIPWKMANISHEKGLSETREQIRQEIENSAREGYKLILFAHSKGGLDCLEALLHYQHIRPFVHSLIAVQSPFYGSPVANFMVETPILNFTTELILKLFGGNAAGMGDLTTHKRMSYIKKNRQKIRELTEQVKIICVASSKSREVGKFDSVLKWLRDAIEGHGHANDGLVPLRCAVLRGATTIKYSDLDHVSAVVRRTPLKFDRYKFSKHLFDAFLG